MGLLMKLGLGLAQIVNPNAETLDGGWMLK